MAFNNVESCPGALNPAMFGNFDADGTTFRTEMYTVLGGRAKTPDEFREQFPFIRELLDILEFAIMKLPQYEADIIRTLDVG